MVISPKPKDVKGLYIDTSEEEAQAYFDEKILPLLPEAYAHSIKLPNECAAGLRWSGYIIPALEKSGWSVKWDSTLGPGGSYVLSRKKFTFTVKYSPSLAFIMLTVAYFTILFGAPVYVPISISLMALLPGIPWRNLL